MFSINDRDRIRDHVLQMAASDERVVAGAVVGSLALGEGNRWSDLDLTFAVDNDIPLLNVLEDWTQQLTNEFDGFTCSTYRVELPFIVCFCFRAACSLIFHSRLHRNSGPAVQSSNCCSVLL